MEWIHRLAMTAALLAIGVATLSGQILQRPKNLPSVLTKPSSNPAAIVERKNVPSILAGKAPVIDLGMADGNTEARDINDVGTALVNNTTAKTCFVWTQADGLKPVLAEGANFSLEGDATVTGVVGRGLNNKGQVAGNVVLSDKRLLAFFWDPESGMRLLGTLGGKQSVAVDLSDNGIVAGSSLLARSKATDFFDNPGFQYFKDGIAFAWAEDMGMVPIGRFGTKNSFATAVNGKGTVVGTFGSHVDGIETMQGFTWTREEGSDVIFFQSLFGTAEHVTSGAFSPSDIRDDGTITGFYYQYGAYFHDKLYEGRLSTGVAVRNGRVLWEFKTPNESTPYEIHALGLNNSDICIGYQRSRKSGNKGTGYIAFAWRPGAELADLEDFASGWSMPYAYRINSKNQVVGYGSKDGKVKGFIMNLSTTLLPTNASRALTKVNDNTKLGPALIKPPKIVKPPK